jgi:hypothetical protein
VRRPGDDLRLVHPRRSGRPGTHTRADGRATLRLPDGPCRLAFARPGYRTETLDLNIARGSPDRHLLGLAGEVHHLAALRSVLAGPHVVTVELPGYVTLRRDVVVEPGHRARVRATLKRES